MAEETTEKTERAEKTEKKEKPPAAVPETAGQDAAAAVAVAGENAAAAPKAPKHAARIIKHLGPGIAHITASFNNTVVSISDLKGNVLAWSSSGRAGFKGSRKSTAFAAGIVGQDVARQVMAMGMKEVEVRIQGPGAGRETAIRSLQSSGLTVSVIKDVTPIPHNGCRPRKRRRV